MSAYILATNVGVVFNQPMEVRVTRNGYTYSRGLESSRYRLERIRTGESIIVTGRTGKWFWITQYDGSVIWIPVSRARLVQEE